MIPAQRTASMKGFVVCAILAAIGLLLIGFAMLSPSGSEEPVGWTALDQGMKSALEGANPDAQVKPPQKSASTKSKSDQADKPNVSAEPSAEDQPMQAAEVEPPVKPDRVVAPNADTPSPANETSPDDGKIDINTATAEQLDTLPGIGASKAKAIVSYREAHGKFKRVEDLLNVKGIGAKMFEKISKKIKAGP